MMLEISEHLDIDVGLRDYGNLKKGKTSIGDLNHFDSLGKVGTFWIFHFSF